MYSQHAQKAIRKYGFALASRVFCASCRGKGRNGERRCGSCDGMGLACPICHGMRFLRSPGPYDYPSNPETPVSIITRCDACCEGNNINVHRELETIQRWLAHTANRERPNQNVISFPAGDEQKAQR